MLFAPEQRKYIPSYPENLRMSPIDVHDPDLSQFPRFERARGLVGVLNAGDIAFIPRVWWHQLRSFDGESISMNFWYGKEASTTYFFRVAMANGPVHSLLPAYHFVRLGLLGGRFEERLFSDVPTGKWLYDAMKGAVRRRMHL